MDGLLEAIAVWPRLDLASERRADGKRARHPLAQERRRAGLAWNILRDFLATNSEVDAGESGGDGGGGDWDFGGWFD